MGGMTSKTPTSITLYGIPNCTSVKKGRSWLDEQGLPYTFHDFKKQGVPADALQRWVDAVGWETLVNRKGTTLIPLSIYFNSRGIAKVELGIATGKKQHDKRETEKKRDWQREKARVMRERG